MTLFVEWRKRWHTVQHVLFKYITFISLILYLMTIFGVSLAAPKYLDMVNSALKLYICLFLIIRFNPWRTNVVFTALDRSIIFTAALMLIAGTIVGQWMPAILVHLDL